MQVIFSPETIVQQWDDRSKHEIVLSFSPRPIRLVVSTPEDKEAALAAIRLYDEQHGYRAPGEWDHVHKVERDEPSA